MNESGNVSPFYSTTCITIASLALKFTVWIFYEKSVSVLYPRGGIEEKWIKILIALIWLDEINVEIGGGVEYKCSRNTEKKN